MMALDLLPNSLPSTPKVDWSIALPGNWLYVFCASCGKDSGHRVRDTELGRNFAFYQCQDCFEKYGSIDGTYAVPDEVFFEKVKNAQIEEYGRVLTNREVAIELQDSSSIISKLKKDGK